MEVKTYKLVIIFAGLVTALIVYHLAFNRNPCSARIKYDDDELYKEINLDRLFRPIDRDEISIQMAEWGSFAASPDRFEVLENIYAHGRKGLLILMQNDKQKHYAALFPPREENEDQHYPLLLWANGLNQRSPTVSITHRGEIKVLLQKLPEYFIAIPSFRGQSLQVGGDLFCSDGFFGDAFDGATDDALGTLEGAIQSFEKIDTTRLAIYGVSRGGTVALLAGIRNPQINCVASQSGPTDFLGKEYLNKYWKQYRYQFFSWTDDENEMRKKIIRSSPAHFIQYLQSHLLVIHGRNDQVVPISHANTIIQLARSENLDTLITNAGHNSFEVQKVISWLDKHNK